MARWMTLLVAMLLLAVACGTEDPVTSTAAAADEGGTSSESTVTTVAPAGLVDRDAAPSSSPTSVFVPTTTGPAEAQDPEESPETPTTPAPEPTAPPTAGPTTTAPPTTAPPTTATIAAPTTVPPTTAPAPPFGSSVRAVTAEQLGSSWREGCPVGVESLRWIEVSHWNDTGAVVTGSIVVHADHAANLVQVFSRMYDARFPVHSMRPIAEFGSSDDASMAANNTSAFNCREISGSPGVWSQHAYGGAIDINPLVNPWVRGSAVDPPAGARYTDRSLDVAGLIRAGDAVTAAFAEIGWGWGGNWSSTLDYQHFSHNGR